jgi:hypothetical protein
MTFADATTGGFIAGNIVTALLLLLVIAVAAWAGFGCNYDAYSVLGRRRSVALILCCIPLIIAAYVWSTWPLRGRHLLRRERHARGARQGRQHADLALQEVLRLRHGTRGAGLGLQVERKESMIAELSEHMIRKAIRDAVARALAAGWTAEQVQDEVAYAITVLQMETVR